MIPEFLNENNSMYLRTLEERMPYIITFRRGMLFNHAGEVLKKERIMYVLNEAHILYAVPGKLEWDHSFFLAGGQAKAAGFIETNENGTIDIISNESNYYKPTLLQMLPALTYFCGQINHYADLVRYESHDEAKSKTIVQIYMLRDIVTNIKTKKDLEKLADLSVACITKQKKLTHSLRNQETLIKNDTSFSPFNLSLAQNASRS